MAQPFLDEQLISKYQIPPAVAIWCNDKKNMPLYIDSEYLPTRFAVFEGGKAFVESTTTLPLPCVVKVSSSAGGDGVRICRTPLMLSAAKKRFQHIQGTIFIEQYIHASCNIGVQFGIPFDASQPIRVVGFNRQLTTQQGEYLGAMIDTRTVPPSFPAITHVLQDQILPRIREKGWYGVGGFDVLIDAQGKFYFIDSNFRMTAATSYLCLVYNHKIKNTPFATFTGTFKGDEQAFRTTVLPLARVGNASQMLHITTLTSHKDGLHFNAALFFDTPVALSTHADFLLGKGVDSAVLRRFSRHQLET